MRAVAVALCVAAQLAGAQDTPRTLIRLTVKDSLGVPVADAGVSVVRGLRDTVLTGATDASGVRILSVPRTSIPVQVIVRKIGFKRADRFLTVTTLDSTSVGLTMQRLVTALAQVTVTEKEDAVRKSYFIDADDIAKSERPILDAADVLIKMRPDMIYSRSGGPAYGVCKTISNIWVNGVPVYKAFARIAPLSMGRRGAAAPVEDPQIAISAMAQQRASVPKSAASVIGGARLTILEEIKPEHIAEISYKDCLDTSVKGNFGNDALFIVLKPGIKYEVGFGSYPMDSPRAAKKR